MTDTPEKKGRARRTDPDTSHIAADKVNVVKLRAIVLHILENFPQGLTIDEIVDQARDYPGCSVAFRPDLRASLSPRMAPMEKEVLLFHNGTKVNKRGVPQIIWCLEKFRPVPPADSLPPASITGKQTELF